MSLTLLLDLDGTLLTNNMDAFVPPYIKALSQHVSAWVEPARLKKVLMAATDEMRRNLDPRLTLMEVFDAAFYPTLGIDKAQLQPALDGFYVEVFPSLKTLTQARPDAQVFVKEALDLKYRVGIATNPLFPLLAVKHRLSWAGLPVDSHPFSLIPSYSSFHFSKPDPSYFAEFLAQMGWPEGPVLVVGDDPQLDIIPARQLGLAGFWVTEGDSPSWSEDETPPPQGSMAYLREWLSKAQLQDLQPDFAPIPAILAVLRSTPAALRSLLLNIDHETWYHRPGVDHWSLVEICCHLRDVERDINLLRLEKILTVDNPFLEGIESDAWSISRDYQQQSGQQAFDEFVESRVALINQLVSLPPELWKRPARHAIFGPTSLYEIIKIISDHDRMHVRQVFSQLQ